MKHSPSSLYSKATQLLSSWHVCLHASLDKSQRSSYAPEFAPWLRAGCVSDQ